MCKLSICIPTHNRRVTLRETLDSIIPQIKGNQEVEILVSDNASTDGTESLIADFVVRYPCIRYNRNSENLGFDGNIVACIENAYGEYISFISDDDIAPVGAYDRLLHEISINHPSIIYLNNHPFLNDNPKKTMPRTYISEDIVFDDGKEFFLFCGLGFISSLTIKTDYAREFVDRAKYESLNQAHLGVAARVALSKKGPFIFLGTLSVAGRIPMKLSDDYVTDHAINVDKLYLKLGSEGLLDGKSIDAHMKYSIRTLTRKILYNKCIGNYKLLDSQKEDIANVYGLYLSYYFFILPFLSMPRSLLMLPYLVLRFMSRTIRSLKYA